MISLVLQKNSEDLRKMAINLIHGDCLEVMKILPDKSIDLILTDPPYGTTACKWDSVIPFEPMWRELKRIAKPNAAICLFGSEPFSSALRMSNVEKFKHDWVWEKNAGSNFATVKFQPMKEHEMISVFCESTARYFPILQERTPSGRARVRSRFQHKTKAEVYGGRLIEQSNVICPELRVPRSIQRFNRERGLHPTQKPVALLEYLIKTYTLEGETVLDFTMGSGSTGVACKNLNRNFIGIENDETYFKIAEKRINEA